MSDKIKQACQKQSEDAYKMFLWFCKWFSYYCIFLLVLLASCNFGVDGTGSKSDPSYYEDYKERMKEMKEEIKMMGMNIIILKNL